MARPSQAGECEVLGCNKPTAELKPYCILHIDKNPSARIVVKDLAEAEAELARAAKGDWERIDPKGIACQDILLALEQGGPATAEGLSRKVNIPPRSIMPFLRKLHAEKLVRRHLSRTQRGKVVLWAVREPETDS